MRYAMATFTLCTIGNAAQINRGPVIHFIPKKVSFDGDTAFQRFLDHLYLEI